MSRDGGLGYDKVYAAFETPLSRRMRAVAYQQDIGQHSWVGAEELEAVLPRLQLTAQSHLLDLGCGPGGPLCFLVQLGGCRGSGMDLSQAGVVSARARANELGIDDRTDFRQGDLDDVLPFPAQSFDAVISLDVILHLADRRHLFREVARMLKPGGRFFFTDAGVETGTMSEEERRLRASTAPLHLVPLGFNEQALADCGLRLVEEWDSTDNVVTVARGRLAARLANRKAFEDQEGTDAFEKQLRYLETTAAVSERRALSRLSVLAEKP